MTKNFEIDPNVTDALKGLLNLIEIEGDDFKSGYLRRKMALNDWVDTFLVEVNAEQRFISTKTIPIDIVDELKYHMATILAESLHEQDCVITKTEESKMTTKVFALKRSK